MPMRHQIHLACITAPRGFRSQATLYVSCRVSRAQAIRAVLLASATTAPAPGDQGLQPFRPAIVTAGYAKHDRSSAMDHLAT